MMWTESSQETLFRGKNHKTTGFFGFGFFGLFAPLNKFLAREWQNPPRWPKLNQYIRVFLVLFAAKFDAPLRNISVESMIIWSSNSGILPNLWSVMLVGKVQTLFPAIHFTPKAPIEHAGSIPHLTVRTWVKSWGPRFSSYKKIGTLHLGPKPTSQLHPLKKRKNIIHQKYLLHYNESGDWFLICVLFWFGAFWLESNSGWGCIHFPRRPQVLKWGSKPC